MKKFDKVRCWDINKECAEEMIFVCKLEDEEHPYKVIYECDLDAYKKGLARLNNYKNAELIEEEFNVDGYVDVDNMNFEFLDYIDNKDDYFKMSHKIKTILRMEAWAKHYNEVDGFVADFTDCNQEKWGIDIYNNLIKLTYYSKSNAFIFQICVASKERAKQMLEKFKDDLEKIFNNK
jgi:hypothetical protein